MSDLKMVKIKAESKIFPLKLGSYLKLGDSIKTKNKFPLDKNTIVKVTKLTETKVTAESPDGEEVTFLIKSFPFKVVK